MDHIWRILSWFPFCLDETEVFVSLFSFNIKFETHKTCNRFPHLVAGSVSSSGPLFAKLDFQEYLQVRKQCFYFDKKELMHFQPFEYQFAYVILMNLPIF